jgi:3-hydroxymyristoyl/3-hydroxydecanoyl-(acyl carrier protein) dehydratase
MEPICDVERLLDRWARVGEAAHARIAFPADLPVFRGHFPGQPLVPGVYQLAAVAATVTRALGAKRIVAVERAKWSAPAYPSQALDISAQWREDAGDVVVDGTVHLPSGEPCATCRLRLR